MIKDLRASIDIGSNSILLLVADLAHGKFVELSKRSEITSLGKELDKNRAFHEDSMKLTFEALKSYAEECDRLGVKRDQVIVTATEASRVAQNAPTFFEKIKKELNLTIQIINAEGEAYYSSRGILFNTKFPSEIITLMDIGGASTELIKLNTKNFQILETISMPIGAVRASQWLDDQLFVQNLQKIFLDFRNDIDKFQTKELFCVAGTMTSLGNMQLQRKEFVEDDVHGLVLKSEEVDQLFKKYGEWTPAQFLQEFPFLQKRANSIRGGLHLVYHLSHRLMVKDLSISTYGLRFGTLLEGKIKKEHLYATR
jgi:exopolyphosphatase/guanosine-5'-triphosphate,3'-diphosphate pyrophosphatase